MATRSSGVNTLVHRRSRAMVQHPLQVLLSVALLLLLSPLSSASAGAYPPAGLETSLCYSLSRCDLCVLPLPSRGLSPVSSVETCMWDKQTHSCVPATLPWDRHGRSCEEMCRAADPSLSFIPSILFPSEQCEASSLCPYVQTPSVCHALYPHEAISAFSNASLSSPPPTASPESVEAATVLSEEDLGFAGSADKLQALLELAQLHQAEDRRAASAEDAAVVAAAAAAAEGKASVSLLEVATGAGTGAGAGVAMGVGLGAGLGVGVGTESGMQALLAAPDSIRLAVLKSKSASFLLKAAGLAHQILTKIFTHTRLVDCDRFAYDRTGKLIPPTDISSILSVASTCPAKIPSGQFSKCSQAQVFLKETGCVARTVKEKCRAAGLKYAIDIQYLKGAGMSLGNAFKCYLLATDSVAPSADALTATAAGLFALLQTLPKGSVVTHVVERRGGKRAKNPRPTIKDYGDEEVDPATTHHYILIGAPGATPNPAAAHPDTHIIVDYWMALAGGPRYLIHPVPAPQNYDPFFPGSVRAAAAAAAAVHPPPARARTPDGSLAPPGPAEEEAWWTTVVGRKGKPKPPDVSAKTVGLATAEERAAEAAAAAGKTNAPAATPSGVGAVLLRRRVASHDLHNAKVLMKIAQGKKSYAWTIIGGAPDGYPMPPWSPKMGNIGKFDGVDKHKGQYSIPKEYPAPESDVAMGLGWHNRKAKLRRATYALLNPEATNAGKEQSQEAYVARRKGEEAVRLVDEKERWMRQFKAAAAMQRRHQAGRAQRAKDMPKWAFVESTTTTAAEGSAEATVLQSIEAGTHTASAAAAAAEAQAEAQAEASEAARVAWAAGVDAEAEQAWSQHVEQRMVALNEALAKVGAGTWGREQWGPWASKPSAAPASTATTAANADADASPNSASGTVGAGLVEVSSDASVASMAAEPPLLPFVDMILAASASASASAEANHGSTLNGAGAEGTGVGSATSVASDILAQVAAEEAAAAAAKADAEAEAEVGAVLLELRATLSSHAHVSASSNGAASTATAAAAAALRRRFATPGSSSAAASAAPGGNGPKGGRLSARAFEVLTRRTAEALRSSSSPFASYSTTTGQKSSSADASVSEDADDDDDDDGGEWVVGGLPRKQARAVAQFLLSLTPAKTYPSAPTTVTTGNSTATSSAPALEPELAVLASPSALAALGRRLDIERLISAAEQRGDLDALLLGLEAVLRAQERSPRSSSSVGGVGVTEEPDFSEDSRWERLKHSLWSETALRPTLTAAAAAARSQGTDAREWGVGGVCGRRIVSPFVDLAVHCALPSVSPADSKADSKKGEGEEDSLLSSHYAPSLSTGTSLSLGIDDDDFDISPLFAPLPRRSSSSHDPRPGAIAGAQIWSRARALAAVHAARVRARLLRPVDASGTATAAEAKAVSDATAAKAARVAAGEVDASEAEGEEDEEVPEAIRAVMARDKAAAAARAAKAAADDTAAAAEARAQEAVSLVEAAAAAAEAGLLGAPSSSSSSSSESARASARVGVKVPLRGKGGALHAALAMTDGAVATAMDRLKKEAEAEAAALAAEDADSSAAAPAAATESQGVSFVDVLAEGGNPDTASASAAAAAAAAAEAASLARRGISPLAARVRASVRDRALAAGAPGGAMSAALTEAKAALWRAKEDGTLRARAQMAAQAWLRGEQEEEGGR